MVTMKNTDNSEYDRDTEKLECFYISSVSINLHNPIINFWLYLMGLNIYTFHDPAILLQVATKKNIVYSTTKIHIE